ncbi:MAG: TIM barrel protein [Armatimonadota bacterium]|nr:TIM barrel protein [Armatimonadota bacterium]MDR5697425.1 TIM barrel protein [Armatimonadota bacterium]
MDVRVGTAPISWGICEIPGWGPQLPYTRVLDEISLAGYAGTELGPLGFLPQDPARLRDELQSRDLVLAAAFVPLELSDPACYEVCEQSVRKAAALLQGLDAREILLADAGDDWRRSIAGRPDLTICHGVPPDVWPGYVKRVVGLARLCTDVYGLRASFHPHGGSYVEHPKEIARLMDDTDPDTLWLCLDTGHVAFGGGDPVALAREYTARIGHVHLKDVDLDRLHALLERGADYVTAARRGVFVELGAGSVDLPGIAAALRLSGYRGWVVVEQDRVVDTSTKTLGSARHNRDAVRWLFDA